MNLLDAVAQTLVEQRLSESDVRIATGNDARPWDIRVNHPRFFRRMLINPSFQIGETYLDGDWECAQLDELFFRLLSGARRSGLDGDWWLRARNWRARLFNRQSRTRAGQVAEHYDLDPALYAAMLDETMTYTCAIWREPRETLDQAQRRKLDTVCQSLELTRGETLLDVGCGFGGLARFAAENYGVRVVGITNSREHQRLATQRCAGLPVEIHLLDYRDLHTLGRTFDKVASIEMIEAVGPKNYARYMQEIHDCLAPGGRFFLQSFLSNTSQYVCNEWFDRYIFPNGVSPSLAQLSDATTHTFGAPLSLVDIGAHYPPTLLAWDERIGHARATSTRRDPRFWRMWHFYLCCLAGVFRAGDLRLGQLLYQPSAAERRVRLPAERRTFMTAS